MLVELGLVDQRVKAVHEVLEGATVVDVARRNGVARQTVHDWLRRYANQGLAGLADHSSKPPSCPHQMTPSVEARIVELRRAHPGRCGGADGAGPAPASSARRARSASPAARSQAPTAHADAGAPTPFPCRSRSSTRPRTIEMSRP